MSTTLTEQQVESLVAQIRTLNDAIKVQADIIAEYERGRKMQDEMISTLKQVRDFWKARAEMAQKMIDTIKPERDTLQNNVQTVFRLLMCDRPQAVYDLLRHVDRMSDQVGYAHALHRITHLSLEEIWPFIRETWGKYDK